MVGAADNEGMWEGSTALITEKHRRIKSLSCVQTKDGINS